MFSYFIKDTHYRNAFETAPEDSLRIDARAEWKDRLFFEMYHGAATFYRVKYGTINLTNDPKGVRLVLVMVDLIFS